MFVVANSTNNKMSIITTILVNINLILPAIHHFPIEKNIRFEVL